MVKISVCVKALFILFLTNCYDVAWCPKNRVQQILSLQSQAQFLSQLPAVYEDVLLDVFFLIRKIVIARLRANEEEAMLERLSVPQSPFLVPPSFYFQPDPKRIKVNIDRYRAMAESFEEELKKAGFSILLINEVFLFFEQPCFNKQRILVFTDVDFLRDFPLFCQARAAAVDQKRVGLMEQLLVESYVRGQIQFLNGE